MAKKHLPAPEKFEGLVLKTATVVSPLRLGAKGEAAAGHNGIIYEGRQTIAGHAHRVAIKCVPLPNLRPGWDAEIRKPLLLPPSARVVRPIEVETYLPPGETDSFVFIVMPWINGVNLRTYLREHADAINHLVCERFAREILAFLHCMQMKGIAHGDIHGGNIIVETPDDAYIEGQEHFWLTDFGIGNSLNDLKPKDDFVESARVIEQMLDVANHNVADGAGRYALDRVKEWLLPRLRDENPSEGLGTYRQPRELLRCFESAITLPPDGVDSSEDNRKLATPFDYMSCEQLGDQYRLLQRLFSLNFPNCPDLLERCNTVLTGPRGCGKTTILRSLATKSQVLGGNAAPQHLERLGVYYHCNDLFFAFPSLRSPLSERMFRVTVHYLNLAILYATLDSVASIAVDGGPFSLTLASAQEIRTWLGGKGIVVSRHADTPAAVLEGTIAQVAAARRHIKDALARGSEAKGVQTTTGLEFVTEFAEVLGKSIPWLRGVPLFIFMDDYSTPRISEGLQASLNRVIFQRGAGVFFKIATESITTLHPYDSDQKLLEVEREYSVIDLGTAFMMAEPHEKRKFVEEVINTRFAAAEAYQLPPIDVLLGDPQIEYTEIARKFRNNEKHYYCGTRTLVDLCSGDITHTLRLVRDMVAMSGGLEPYRKGTSLPAPVHPIADEVQHKAILKLGADFLANVEAAPLHGPQVRKIVDAFGQLAHWELMHLVSPNQTSMPPKQFFRIEVRENFHFDDSEKELREVYDTLLRYGVFVRDATGKSLRWAVVPRLYLRRLLVPLFRLTFSKRDNLGLEAKEFKQLLANPDQFKAARMVKSRVGDPHTLTLRFSDSGADK